MKKISNKQIAQAFRNAVPCLDKRGSDENKHFYICFAIEQSPDTDYYVKAAAMGIISDRIAPCTTLEEWLEERGVPAKQLENPATYNPTRRLQQHRYAWLKQLITEFENKK